MPISPTLTHCTEVKTYHLQSFHHPQISMEILEPGLSVVLSIDEPSTLNYQGGHLEYIGAGGECWVNIVEIKGDWMVGKLDGDFGFLKAGSYIHFKPEHVMTVSGNVDWQIRHLSVLASEKVVYHQERVGYYYYCGCSENNPFDSGRIYYAESEMHEPKENIRLIEVPLSSLVAYDPLVGQFLEMVSIDGIIRIGDLSFEQYLAEPRDTCIYPRGYIADWEVEEDDILEDDPDLPF